jgi:hypothetical protein
MHGPNQWKQIALRRNDPAPSYSNSLEKDLCFSGRVILKVEEIWNNELTLGTRLDGEIVNRVAIYERADGGYVAEQLRFNPRVIFNPHARGDLSKRIPFMSLAEEFRTVDAALAWIQQGMLIREGDLSRRLNKEIARVAAG